MVELHYSDMSTEVTSGDGEETTESGIYTGVNDDLPDDDEPEEEGEIEETENEGALFSFYRRFIGEPDTARDVYLGFGLFFTGISLGAVAFVMLLYSGSLEGETSSFWQFREIAVVCTMLALPTVGLSVTTLLPVGKKTIALSFAGGVFSILGAIWFTQVYPYEWTATGNDVSVIATYSIGVVLLAASTGSALVAQYVDSLTLRQALEAAKSESSEEESGEGLTDEEIEGDIDDAVANSNLNWGGVEQNPNTERLSLNMPESDVDISDADLVAANERRASSETVESAVTGLQELKGGDKEAGRTESPDDQVNALSEFRKKQEKEGASESLETGIDKDPSFFDRLMKKLFG